MPVNVLVPESMPFDKEYEEFQSFLHRFVVAGVISIRELEAITEPIVDFTKKAGTVSYPSDTDDSFNPVLRHATHQMKRILLKLHPELAAELRAIDRVSRGR